MSLGSFGFVWYILACPGGRWVHSGSFSRALDVAEFIRAPCEPFAFAWFVGARPGCRLAHSGAPCEWLGSFAFVWFIREHPLYRWVRTGSFGSFGRTLGVGSFMCVVGFIRAFVWYNRARIGSRLVHSGTPAVFVCNLVRLGAHFESLVSFAFVWFIRSRAGVPWLKFPLSFGKVLSKVFR